MTELTIDEALKIQEEEALSWAKHLGGHPDVVVHRDGMIAVASRIGDDGVYVELMTEDEYIKATKELADYFLGDGNDAE